jgi:hypothetical protein
MSTQFLKISLAISLSTTFPAWNSRGEFKMCASHSTDQRHFLVTPYKAKQIEDKFPARELHSPLSQPSKTVPDLLLPYDRRGDTGCAEDLGG